jgi:hypothetical protein
MIPKRKRWLDWDFLRAAFDPTPEERKLIAGVFGLILLGMMARYYQLKKDAPRPAPPAESRGERP